MSETARLNPWTPYALSLLRIFVGLTFVQHGTRKFFNFPSGPGFKGIDLTTMYGWAGTIELFAGTLILLGLFTRPAVFIAAGEMAVGYFVVHAPQSFFTAKNGGDKDAVIVPRFVAALGPAELKAGIPPKIFIWKFLAFPALLLGAACYASESAASNGPGNND